MNRVDRESYGNHRSCEYRTPCGGRARGLWMTTAMQNEYLGSMLVCISSRWGERMKYRCFSIYNRNNQISQLDRNRLHRVQGSTLPVEPVLHISP